MQSFEFLSNPNIPDDKIKLCAIASGFPQIKAALVSRGIEVIEAEPLKILQKPVRSHADMQMHDLGKGSAVVASGAEKLKTDLESFGFNVELQELKKKYPEDIALNCFCISKKLFCKKENTSETLLNYYQSIRTEIADVNQGYTKCSTAIVNQSSIITSDTSIAQAAKNYSLEVLIIHSGGILLPGYDTGFIGGCCGLISNSELAFTGRLSKHPDSDAIILFCESRGISIVELTDSKLVDIGGILPLAI